MKGLLKRAAAVLLMAVCLMNLSACSAQEDTSAPKISTEGAEADAYTAQMVLQQALSILSISEEQLNIQKSLYEMQGNQQTQALIETLVEARREYGSVHGVDAAGAKVVQLPDQTFTVSMVVTFDEGEMTYVMNVDSMTGAMQAEFIPVGGADASQTVSQKMESGGLYAALGIGTVFSVLVFISLLIYCFKFIHRWEENRANGGAKKTAPAPVAAPVPAAAPAPAAPAQDLMEDAELVAVISAAIAAYEGTSSNGLVVRSIRRLPGSRRK